MSQTKGKIIDHFYGGIIRDEKTRIDGAALNVEELDIFENANFVRAAQVMTRVATSSSSPSSSPSASPATASPTSSPSSTPSSSPSSSTSSSPSPSGGYDDVLHSSLVTSLVAFYRFAGSGDDAYGTYDLTAINSPSYTTGKSGQGVDLESSASQKFTRATSFSIDETAAFSISFWFNAESLPSAGSSFLFYNLEKGVGNGYSNLELRNTAGTYYIADDGSNILQSFSATTGNWFHVVITKASGSGATCTIYINGSAGDTGAALTTGGQAANFNLGAAISSSYFDGILDEFGVWVGRTLSAADVSNLYNGGSGIPFDTTTAESASASPSTSVSSSPSASVFPQDQTEITAYTGDLNDNAWGYGGDATTGAAQIFKLTNAGSDTPGSFELVNISGDIVNEAFPQSPLQYHKTTEANAIYYLKKAGTDISVVRYDIDNGTEDVWTGSAWSTVPSSSPSPSPSASPSASAGESGDVPLTSQLTGLTGTNDRYFMRVEFGELYIGNGNYIAKVDSEGTFIEKAFQLPLEWEAVDITFVSDVGLILARNINRKANFSKAFWWDLTSEVQFDNQITIPHGGPQWIVNFKERLYVLCAQNGVATFYSSVASPGVPLQKVPGMELANLAAEGETQEISSPKMMAIKDGILYFGLYKTDKTGIYAIGSLDEDKPTALILAKRFDTTDYSRHVPIALHTQGPNFYASYEDNGAFKHARCESNNNPDRSSNAIYESVVFDEGDPTKNKDILGLYVMTKPLAQGTSVTAYIKPNYGTYTQVLEENSVTYARENALLGNFRGKSVTGKTHQFKFQLSSNGSTSPIVTGLAYVVRTSDLPAYG